MRVDFHQRPKTSPNKIIVGIMDRRYASPWPRVGEQSEQTCRSRAPSWVSNRHDEHLMSDQFRCFHSDPPRPEPERPLTVDTLVDGVVVCVHVFGLGIYLPSEDAFGHVNVTVIGVERTRGLDDYPAVGERLGLRVLGYSRTHQLRLAAKHAPVPPA